MNSCLKTVGIMFLISLLISPYAFATPIPIVNPSFEFPIARDINLEKFGAWTKRAIDGWEYEGDTYWGVWSPGAAIGNFYGPGVGVPDGDSIGFLSGGSISQTLNWKVSAENIFTVSLEIGNRFDYGTPGYGVELWAGDRNNILVASDGSVQPKSGQFAPLTMSYIAGQDDPNEGLDLGITIFSVDVLLTFDNLKISNDSRQTPDDSTPVPEPTTMLLLATGLLGIAGFGRKKFKN